MGINAVIIDDEPKSAQLLQLQLEQHCPIVEKTFVFTNPLKALEEIPLIAPNLVFLDIEMPGIDGFELLSRLSPVKFNVVFVTAFNQYAVKACKLNALDYLLKPVQTSELIEAVEKSLSTSSPTTTQISLIQRQLKGEIPQKIAINSNTGIVFIELNDIIFAHSINNYSKLRLVDDKEIIIPRALKEVQDILEGGHFSRVHKQYLINLNHVKGYNKQEGMITMIDKSTIPISRYQKDKFINFFGWL